MDDVLRFVRGDDDDYAPRRQGYSVVSWIVHDDVLTVHAIRDADCVSETYKYELTRVSYAEYG